MLPLDAFYKHPAMADGHLNKCKECQKSDMRQYRRDSDRPREIDRLRGSRATTRKAIKKWQAANRVALVAHAAVARAIKRGELKRQPCAVCGAVERIHAHHEDYARPLDVVWLCALHHARLRSAA